MIRMVRGSALVAAALATLFIGPTPDATAAPKGVRVRYYDVRGLSGGDIDRELARKGPIVDGRRALAATAVSLRQAVQLGVKGRGCAVVGATVTVRADVTLPRWRDRARGHPLLRKQWDGFAAFAAAHEQKHVDIANAYARKMERALRAIPSARDCGAISTRVARTTDRLLVEYSRAQDAFDVADQKRLGRLIHGGRRMAAR